jgi:hypothetical protein
VENHHGQCGHSETKKGHDNDDDIVYLLGNNFDTVVLPDTDAGVGSTEIDTDGFTGYGGHFDDCFSLR